MQTSFRQWARVACAAALSAFIASPAAQAQAYPAKPVTIVVGLVAGGPLDATARMLSTHLTKAWGQQVIVDNRPGGNGTVAGTLVSKAAPDGYTLLLSTRAITMNAALYSNLPYDTGKAFTPVVRVLDQPNVLVVSRNFPARGVPQFLKLVKENPGKYTYGSTGNGSIPHLSAEMFKQVTGAQLIHVPYKGAAPMMVDLMASRIDMAFTSPSSAMAQINEGHAFMIGIAADKRSALLPDVPAFSEFGVADFNVVSWYGLFAPPATPPAVVNRINADVNAFLRTEEAAKRLAALGATPASSTPASYRAQFDDDLVRFRKLVREVGLKID